MAASVNSALGLSPPITNMRIASLPYERDTFEAPDGARRKRNHIEWIKINRFDLTFLIFPAAAPCPGHGNESLIGVVVVHHRTFAWLGAAIAEIKALGDRVADNREASSPTGDVTAPPASLGG